MENILSPQLDQDYIMKYSFDKLDIFVVINSNKRLVFF